MKTWNGYDVVHSPETFEIDYKKKEPLDLCCCDCALTHRIRFKVKAGKLKITIKRLEKETIRLRELKGKCNAR